MHERHGPERRLAYWRSAEGDRIAIVQGSRHTKANCIRRSCRCWRSTSGAPLKISRRVRMLMLLVRGGLIWHLRGGRQGNQQ